MKKYDILDLTKYILSFFIVAIHSEIFPMILYPWLRIAVPVYFMISSYLLFSRINADPEHRAAIVKKFVIRLVKLYLFWSVVLLPVTVYARRGWFSDGIFKGMIHTVSNLFFSSTFIASWFITATIGAVLILYFISKKKVGVILCAVTCIIYIVCCVRSSYYSLIKNETVLSAVKIYEYIFASPVFSFPVALFWMTAGKAFADGRFSGVKLPVHIVTAVISAVCLYIEWRYVFNLNGSYSNDCYFFLAPLCVSLFGIILNFDISLKNARTLRQISTVTYPLHASLVYVFRFVLRKFISDDILIAVLIFVFAVICCHLVYLLISRLEKVRRLSFLKYAH